MLEGDQMTTIPLKEAIEAFTNLTETLQECIKAQDIDGAIALAGERHDALICLLEKSDSEQNDKLTYAQFAIRHLRNEYIYAKESAHKDRSDFIARKSAIRAYALKAA